MKPQTWTNWLRRQWRATSPIGSRQPRGRARFRPRLEALEDRLTPATHQWTGAVNNLWSDNGNWVNGSPVGDANAVLIFPTSPTNPTSLNNVASIPIQEIDIFGSGYTIGTTNSANRIILGT